MKSARLAKRQTNETYARQHPARDRVARRRARATRVAQRDRAWLERMGIA